MTPGSVAMLIGETTGLRVQPTAPSLGAANVRIQGLRGRYSQVLADGLPLYGGQGDSFSLLQVPPLDLGQVEIIKGAASALYGASALGGVINLVSRRPTGPGQGSASQPDLARWKRRDGVAGRHASRVAGTGRCSAAFTARAGATSTTTGGPTSRATSAAWYGRGCSTRMARAQPSMLTGGVIAENRRGGTVDGGRCAGRRALRGVTRHVTRRSWRRHAMGRRIVQSDVGSRILQPRFTGSRVR